MATVYKVEVVSPWQTLSEQEVRSKIEQALSREGNKIKATVIRKDLY